ncbi:hypothetical protein PWT90_06469 [Aphanocladium album]|nr:hypothetical protein PWT90_06469 [Aphanocladium album]
MRYQENSGNWTTKHWSSLWRSNISTLACLKDITPHTGFVAIDAEPWRHDSIHVAEIGLSLIQPFDLNEIAQPFATIEEMQKHVSLSTYSIKICGREQGKREHFLAQHNMIVKPEELENELREVLLSFRDSLATQNGKPLNAGSSAPSLVLVGFDLAFELSSLSSLYPKILDCFSAWLDLQELVKDAAQLGKAENPSMRDSLSALGFGRVSTDIGSMWKKHTAAKDTLRIAAVLVGLLLRGLDQGVLPLTFTHRRKWSPGKASGRYRGTGKLFNNERPKPRENFPFTAKISLCGARAPPSKVKASDLMDIFADYNPTAVGSLSQGHATGFVSLPSLHDLEHFILSINGKQCEEYGGSWTAISIFDPTLTPARTAEELEQYNKMKLQETITEKRQLMQQKKLGEERTKEEPKETCPAGSG